MAVTVSERHESLTFAQDTSIERRYYIRGTTSETVALQALLAASPPVYSDYIRGKCTVKPELIDLSHPEACIWDGTVPYAPANRPPPREPMEIGQSMYEFNTSGGTQHITQSLKSINRYPAATAPDHKGAIGVTGSAVEGVDVTIPVFAWSETHVKDGADVDAAYAGTLYRLTSQTNDALWRAFGIGEVLFLGASGSRRGDDAWSIRFSFAASPDKTDKSVGDITGIAKKGWEYLWIRYQHTISTVGGVKYMVQEPEAVYIERVYEEGTFADLEIGA